MAKIHQVAILLVLVALAGGNLQAAGVEPKNNTIGHGLGTRTAAKAFLSMPQREDGEFPLLLSQTGVFKDTRNLVLNKTLIPYDLLVSFWSDGANKSRAVVIPKGKIKFSPDGDWEFPRGTVFVKTFELPIDETNPAVKRRLETRLLVRDSGGGIYGVTYKWRADDSDADLLDSSMMEAIPIKTANGTVREQSWYYPSRKDCLTCHAKSAGGVLGVKTRQMNREFMYPSGVKDNQLRAWNHVGLFEPSLKEEQISTFSKLAPTGDLTRSLEDRARSYLDVNCAYCHHPGGTVAYFDARYDTPLAKQELIGGAVLIDQGIDRARVISPHDVWRSIAFRRIDTVGDIRMPPLARQTIDEQGVALMEQWIKSLPGQEVLSPPSISPTAGTYDAPIQVSLQASEPGAEIRYTLDGSVPGASDLRYEKPITLNNTAILRARSFKDGFTRSITVQAVFVIDK